MAVNIHGKCLTETKWKEFKEWIREDDLHPVHGSHPCKNHELFLLLRCCTEYYNLFFLKKIIVLKIVIL